MTGPSSKKDKPSRFPAARIKKIMQSDEEVGKVASSVPVMVSKSLELFMDDLLDKACVHTRMRGSKKLTPGDLKKAINTNPELDWLLDLASRIPESAVEESTPRATTSARRQPNANSMGNPNGAPRKRATKKESVDQAYGYQQEPLSTTNPSSLPHIGTWKKDPVGGGGTGEGGRGMFDDYEEDDDDY